MDEKLCKNFYKLCKIDKESENVYDNSGYKDGEKPDRRKFEKQKEHVLEILDITLKFLKGLKENYTI